MSFEEMHAKMVYKDHKILELDNCVTEKDKAVMDLNELVSEKNEVITGRNKVIQILQDAISEKDRMLHENQILICKLQEKITQAKEETSCYESADGKELIAKKIIEVCISLLILISGAIVLSKGIIQSHF